jgi:hypothetical protein
MWTQSRAAQTVHVSPGTENGNLPAPSHSRHIAGLTTVWIKAQPTFYYLRISFCGISADVSHGFAITCAARRLLAPRQCSFIPPTMFLCQGSRRASVGMYAGRGMWYVQAVAWYVGWQIRFIDTLTNFISNCQHFLFSDFRSNVLATHRNLYSCVLKLFVFADTHSLELLMHTHYAWQIEHRCSGYFPPKFNAIESALYWELSGSSRWVEFKWVHSFTKIHSFLISPNSSNENW